MRVTQSMLNNQMLQNLQANNTRLQTYQDMLSTNKKINKPSDDPIGASFSMRYKAQLERNTQYKRNLDSVRSSVDMTDSTISKVNDVLQRVRELAVQGASDTVPSQAKNAIAQEVTQMKEEMLKLGNTQFNGKYIFNGEDTTTQPYTATNPQAAPVNSTAVLLSISDGVTIQTNVSGQDVFGTPGAADHVFQIMDDLITNLQGNNSAGVGKTLGGLDSRLDKLYNSWAVVGARSHRLDLVENRLNDSETNLTALRSKTEDADAAEVITNLKMAEAVQRSSLAAGARVLQPSLLDFLR